MNRRVASIIGAVFGFSVLALLFRRASRARHKPQPTEVDLTLTSTMDLFFASTADNLGAWFGFMSIVDDRDESGYGQITYQPECDAFEPHVRFLSISVAAYTDDTFAVIAFWHTTEPQQAGTQRVKDVHVACADARNFIRVLRTRYCNGLAA